MDKPFENLSEKEQKIILYGGDDILPFRVMRFGTHRYETKYHKFEGVIPFLEKGTMIPAVNTGVKRLKNIWLQLPVRHAAVQD